MLEGVIPYAEAGFALHWLRPRSKAPINKDWSTASVASPDVLRASYQAGYNVGVRLGEPSRVAGGYLHAIDMDIRVADLVDEAHDALRDLFGGVDIETLPSVVSGSGGASRHLYFVSAEPFYSRKLAMSESKHRGRDGKWHYDWEIELFGTGKQVAMPPSIHPDTGKPYRWERPFDLDMLALGVAPMVDAARLAEIVEPVSARYEFEDIEPLTFKAGQLERDLGDIPDDRIDDYHDWVTLGQALHHQFGGAREGYDLWVAQSKRSDKFDERQMPGKWRGFGRNRRRPVTMASVRQWAIEARQARIIDEFDDLPDVPFTSPTPAPAVSATDSDVDALLGGVSPEPDPLDTDDDDEIDPLDAPVTLDWPSLLDFTEEGGLRGTLHNVRLIVQNDPRITGVVAFNEFTQEVVQRGKPGVRESRKNAAKPFLQLEGATWDLRDPANGDFWTEDKDNAIRALIEAPKTQGGYGFKVPDRDLRAAIDIAGRRNPFHPVREYLHGLKWDGKPRVEQLFVDYLGAPDDAYHRDVARIMAVAAVTRVHEPGEKFDTAVILEGLQGKRKSTFISILAKSWFVELDCDITDTQQVVETLQGAWIAEMNELGGFTKADVRHIKAFISRRSDKVRLAYAKRAQEYHRQSILIGSTNDDVYLKDSTGGRRFLPVRCMVEGEIDTDRLIREVDQFWAEALVMYQAMRAEQPHGTLPLYLSDREAREIAEQLQESRLVESSEDALAGRIAEWLSKPIISGDLDDDLDRDGNPKQRHKTCLIEIWCECLGREESQYQGMWPAALGRAMRMVPGWKQSARRSRFGKYGQQRGFERTGWIADVLPPKSD